ncbi:MAG TPA: methyltransferase domain-containing protein [Candidatus Xenobia bacterium]|jgi:ubiquinone/menaquinone biosynthesis C-methylase UbiE
MAEPEFDQHAGHYQEVLDQSLAAFGETTEFYARLKAQQLLAYTASTLGTPRALSCLDVGCGTGVTMACLDESFSSLSGCDISTGMVAEAAKRLPAVHLEVCQPGVALPFADRSFDVAYTACTLHHVPVADRPAFVAEMVRVVRPGGLVFTFEHNPYNPVTRAVVKGCEFDNDAILLTPREARQLFSRAGLDRLRLRYYIWFPRSLGFLRGLEPALGRVPLGGQYVLAGRRAP